MVNVKDPLFAPGTDDDELNIQVWVNRIIKNRPSVEQYAIIEACELAKEAHRHQYRISGEPYIIHVVTVADILADLGMDTDVIVAAILHDAVDQAFPNRLNLNAICNRFGETVEALINGVNRMRLVEELSDQPDTTVRPHPDKPAQAENLRKMLLAMVEDVRVVLIKLADRLDNMRILRYMPPERQRRSAQQTLDLFAPLANCLGIWQIKWELEDLSLRYLEPAVYKHMAKLLDERRVDRERFIQKVMQQLEEALVVENISAEVMGRPKHIYSIWLKMQRKGLDFHQIFDVRAVRVLVRTEAECYLALRVVHHNWQPIKGEFDDYIANPKKNNYQSLHTAVIGPENKIFEVQIRTYDMHHHAELGVAAHWRYKEGSAKKRDADFEKRIAWFRTLLQWKEESDADEFLARFKSEVGEERVYVLSPHGKVVDLPQGSTPLDFAYYIHTELGHRCRGAKVNNALVPLNYVLKSGDQVEILTTNEEKPSRDWLNSHLNYIKTSRARGKVRQWLNKQDNEQHLNNGRALLVRELRRLNLPDLNHEQLAQRLQFKSLKEFLIALGRGDMQIAKVTQMINEQFFPKPPQAPVYSVVAENDEAIGGVFIHGVGNLLTHTARCCNPVPYDAIVGYITKGRGVVIHRRDCPNALRWQEQSHERLIEVEWSQPPGKQPLLYPVDILVRAYDRFGLLRDVGTIAANEKINIVAANTLSDKKDNIAKMIFTLEVISLDVLSRILAKIDNLPNVIEASRKK